MYILGLGEAWSRISWECGKWETQTPTYGYYSLCCTPEYYTYLAWIEQFYSKLLVWLTDWLGDVEICDGQEDTESIKTLLSPGNPHLLPLNTSYTDISADKFAENNFYQLWTVYKERGGTLFCWQLDKTGHPAPPGRNHQEGGGGGGGGGGGRTWG